MFNKLQNIHVMQKKHLMYMYIKYIHIQYKTNLETFCLLIIIKIKKKYQILKFYTSLYQAILFTDKYAIVQKVIQQSVFREKKNSSLSIIGKDVPLKIDSQVRGVGCKGAAPRALSGEPVRISSGISARRFSRIESPVGGVSTRVRLAPISRSRSRCSRNVGTVLAVARVHIRAHAHTHTHVRAYANT